MDEYLSNPSSSTYSESDAYGGTPMTTEAYIDGSGVFLGKVYTDNLVVGQAKITAAMIENLVVGTNVQMGENAVISWNQITDQPFIPQTAADVGALPVNSPKLTYISPTGIYTGVITANQINALGLNINNQFVVDDNGNVTFSGNLNGATGTFSGSVKAQTLLIDSQVNQSHMLKMRLDTLASALAYMKMRGYTDSIKGSTLEISEEFNGYDGSIDYVILDTLTLDLVQGNFITQGMVTALMGIDLGSSGVIYTSGRSWNSPTLLNGWTNNGSGFEPAGYYKDALGIVRLKGLIKGGTMGTTAFVLPVGHRPANRRAFPVVTSGGLGRVDIDTSGNVIVMTYGTASNGYVSLDGIQFLG